MSTSPQHRSMPLVRDLTRWRIPFHYAPPIAVAVLGIVMLLVGGIVGGFGGWLLAVVLPIAIGAFLRSPWFALVPVAVWAGWLLYVSGADPEASLSHTPFELALVLATIGAGATLLAQRAIFPATEPAAWKASIGRPVPPLDDGETPDLADDLDEDALDEEVALGIEATDDELERADAAAAAEAEAAALREAKAQAKRDAKAARRQAKADRKAAKAAGAEDDATDHTPAVQVPEPRTDAPAVDLVKTTTATAAAAEPAGEKELPLDADPAPLDEGGHVTEFPAISEADLGSRDAAPDADELRTTADADSEAAAH